MYIDYKPGAIMRIILCVILSLMIHNFSFSQKSLSLDEAIRIALQRNTTLQKAQNNIKTFESGLLTSYGNLLPDISASGSFSWSKSEDEGGTAIFSGFPITLPNRVSQDRTYSAGIQANWLLFDGLSNFTSISRDRNQLESARLSLERLKEDIVFQTIDLYYLVINTQQLVKFREEDVAWNQKNFETVNERNRLGAVTLADVYAQQVRVGNAELELIRAKNNLETAKSNLLYYLGLDVLAEHSFADPLSELDLKRMDKEIAEDFKNLRELVDRALNRRYGLPFSSAKC
jgi:outer membrane protein